MKAAAHLSFVALCAAAGLLLCAGSASARVLEGEISETEPGDALEFPLGLAVDSSDHLWVTDASIDLGGEVHKYSPAGNWEASTDSPPWGNAHLLESIAFDGAAGRVFVSDSNNESLWGLNPADASYAGIELNPVGEPPCCVIRVAADNSGGLYDGSLYVFSDTGHIVRIDADGDPVDYTEGSSAGSNELSGADTPSGFFAGPHELSGAGIAVDAVGHLWVADSPFFGEQVVYEFAPTGRYIRTITHAGPHEFEEVNAVAIDPTTGNVVVSEIAANDIHEFTPAGAFAGTTPILSGGAPLGVAVDSTGTLYVSGICGEGCPGDKVVGVFGPAGPPADKHTLEIEVTGAGEVVGAGIACAEAGNATAACDEGFVEGSEVPLSAMPADGHRFTGWTVVEGDAGSCAGATASCETGALSVATKLEAAFVPMPDEVVPPQLPPPPVTETPIIESPPGPARLRIGKIRVSAAREKLKIAVGGTIATAARGVVRATVSTRLHGRLLSASKRVRILDGRWSGRLALAGVPPDAAATIKVTARFEGSPGVRGDHAKRRVELPR